jgi:hypothetical protein
MIAILTEREGGPRGGRGGAGAGQRGGAKVIVVC